MATIHSPNIGRRDRKGRSGGCDLEGSKTYGVGRGKLWHHGAKIKPELQLHEPVEVMKIEDRKWKLEAGSVEFEGERSE